MSDPAPSPQGFDPRGPVAGPLPRQALAALFIDIVESVRLMERHEEALVAAWRALVARIDAGMLRPFGGRLVKSHGDGALLSFPSAHGAAEAAAVLNRAAAEISGSLPASAPLQLRSGLHYGDVMVDHGELYGRGVNLAARLQSLAGPGEICLSDAARDGVIDGQGWQFFDDGDHHLKHLDAPVRVHRGRPVGPAQSPPPVAPLDMRPGIAVLPFLQAWGGDEHLGLGQAIADSLTAAFSQSAGWRVLSPLSMRRCAGQAPRAELGRLLGVDYLVSGRWRASGSRLQLKVALAAAATEEQLWTEGLELELGELIAGQSAAFQALVATVGQLVLGAELARCEALPFSRLQDYSLYLSAIALMHRLNRADQQRAWALIEALSERHRRSAEPAALRTRWHALQMVQGRAADPAAEGRLALASARAALDRDSQHRFALPMAALLSAQMGEALLPAVAQAQTALAAHPQEPMAGLALAALRGYCGDALDFERHSACSSGLTPLDPALYVYLSLAASAKLAVGKDAEAADLSQRALRANATYVPAYVALAVALQRAGRIEQARASAAHILALQPGFRVSHWVSEFHGRAPPDVHQRADALRALDLPH